MTPEPLPCWLKFSGISSKNRSKNSKLGDRRFSPAGLITRVEVMLTIDGTPRRMRLTLGALAELEAALECDSLVALVERFEAGDFSTRDVLALIAAGLRGGGAAMSQDMLMRAEIAGGPMVAARAAAELLARAFMPPDTT